MSESRNTKRADRRALVDAGKRYHAAKLAYLYDTYANYDWDSRRIKYKDAEREFLQAAEVYAVGRKQAKP